MRSTKRCFETTEQQAPASTVRRVTASTYSSLLSSRRLPVRSSSDPSPADEDLERAE
jgi:hypothetical protein